jgi:hypothetical protein
MRLAARTGRSGKDRANDTQRLKTLVLCIINRGQQFAPKGATLDQNLVALRQRMIETTIEFLRAQRAYLVAAAPGARQSEAKLKKAAEGLLIAAEPYADALQELRQYLLAAESSEAIALELDHTERLINALDIEKKVSSKLIATTRNKYGS